MKIPAHPDTSANTDPEMRSLLLCHGAGRAGVFFKETLLKDPFRNVPVRIVEIESLQHARSLNPALIMLDSELLDVTPFDHWRSEIPDALLISESNLGLDTDLILADGIPVRQSRNVIQLACESWVTRKRAHESFLLLNSTEGNLNKLASVGIALAAENDLATLLRKILSEGQNISNCDAASLFLISNDGQQMTFKLTQNDSIDFPFQENSFPLDSGSISGYVALTKVALNISDAYNIPENALYQFNRTFDINAGYRTVSMLTLPVMNRKKSVIAVLQFINRKTSRTVRLSNDQNIENQILSFDKETVLLLQSLAGQAGVAIENAILYNDIQKLFDGFVKASVMAIEQRDPTTSGHSFRVADLCVALVEAVNCSSNPQHAAHKHNEQQIRELRYAALLHDFGKVGVRESILVKAKKLSEETVDSIHYRILLAKERLKNKALKTQLQLHQSGQITSEKVQRIEVNLVLELEQLDQFMATILEANEPSLLDSEGMTSLNRIAAYCTPFERRHGFSIVSDAEFKMLTIRKGSLSPEERLEIESHVTHTQNFLKLIPWTEEFKNVPHIAGAHHEKLDGSGYPNGMSAHEIPFASKIMTICDIYDALTASDRPYKAAISTERALDILQTEADAGAIDQSIIDVFVTREIYKAIEGKDYSGEGSGVLRFNNSVCDFDLHHSH